MNALPFLVVVWLLVVGLYGIATCRNSIYLVSALFVAQSSGYLLLLSIGYVEKGTAPITGDIPGTRIMVDPVVQALTLTDIVVGATVSALLLALALQRHKRSGTLDPKSELPMRG